MIKEINVIGSKETTLHDFSLVQSDMDLIFSHGSYISDNIERFTTEIGATVTISSATSDTHYEIWLNDGGLVILSRIDGEEFGEVTNFIDKLVWFTVPALSISLDNVEINYVKVVEQ